jgi:2-oxoisovalerate dehydrogenase E1 component alpha subunit
MLSVYQVTREAHDRALRGEGPTLIDAQVSRLTPHSSDDDERRYRSQDEIAAARRNDPLVRARTYLQSVGLLDEDWEIDLANRVRAAIQEALDCALSAPPPDPASATRHVFKES